MEHSMTARKNAPDLKAAAPADTAEASQRKKVFPNEKYYEVEFAPMTQENELPYHYIGVNGEAVQVQKGSRVVLPERFLRAADDAKVMQYSRRGEPIGEVSRCQYREIREATREEYLKMKAEGTKKHNEAIRKANRATERQAGDR